MKEQALQMKMQWASSQDDFLQMLVPGGGADRLAENLVGLKAAEYPADSITDVAVAAIAVSQKSDGSWNEVQVRSLLEESNREPLIGKLRLKHGCSIGDDTHVDFSRW
jgi:hypothetical protein